VVVGGSIDLDGTLGRLLRNRLEMSALGNGVKGGKWFRVDKVIRPETLEAAWRKVERNKGSSGIDGQSVERFAAGAERYLAELHQILKDGGYRPAPVKRVDIPKGGGQTRPLGIPTVKSRRMCNIRP
jgi:RNA-directed DNA polymerase